MGLRERLLNYIAYKGIDKATLERKSGLSNDAVNKMGDNTRVSTLDKISNAFPDINIAWLKTGVGEMILGSEENKHKRQSYSTYRRSDCLMRSAQWL